MSKLSKRIAVCFVFFAAASILSPEGMNSARAQTVTLPFPGYSVDDIVEIIEDLVPPSTTRNVYTVPGSRILFVTDVLIVNAWPDLDADDQAILRDGSPATCKITVAHEDTFSHTFSTGILFTGGQVVAVKNGDPFAGNINFYLRGVLLKPVP